MRLSAAEAAALSRDSRVLYVAEDSVVEVADTQPSAPWGLDRVDQRTLPLNGLFNFPAPNNQVYVHVLDTGVRTTHVEFGGRAFIFGDYIDDDGDGDPNDIGNDDGNPSVPDGADCHGHGTHVASTIAGSTYGVAKSALIFSHRVLDCSGTGSVSGILAALDAVAGDARRPAIVNMSMAGPANPALDTAVLNTTNAGVTVVVAAGNSGVDAGSTSPARAPSAITVGATDINDVRASWSNFGSVVDLFAPGVGITAAWFGSDTATTEMSGTSMASPHVAGVAALYLGQVGNRTPAQVRTALVAAATPGVVVSAGTGSPNLLVYSGFLVNAAPTVSLTSPANGATATAPASFTVAANAADSDGTVSQVVFYANGSPIGTDTTAPYSLTWSNVAAGSYILTAVATDNGNAFTTSNGVTVTVVPSGGGTTVAFVGTDSTTQGNWKGVYGGGGSVLVGDVTNLPVGTSVTTATSTWTWAGSTSDVRALRKTNSSTDRLAATWYMGSGTFDVTPGDAAPHRLTLYAVDWDQLSRSERIEMLDPVSGIVLDSRTLSGFGNGLYVTWRVTGPVRIRVTLLNGVNAVVSGVFLDADTTSTPRVNVAAAVNGGLATASSSGSAAYAPAATIDGERAGANWLNGGGWYDATPFDFPDWLQVQFSGGKTIDEVDVYSVQDNYAAPSTPTSAMTFSRYGLTDFRIEYWTGTTWQTIPGATVAGNSLVWRKITFAPVSTTSIRLVVTGAADAWSRVVELEAYTNGGAPQNAAPTVNLTAPADGASATAPASFTVSANAADSDGTVAQVVFYANGSPIGTDTTAPYSITWSNVPAGSYTLTAVATDNGGASMTSSGITVTVNAPSRTNVAAAVNGGVAIASSSSPGYGPAATIDGERAGTNWINGGGWYDATPFAFPDWLQVQFGGSKTIDEVDVYSVQDNYAAPATPTSTMTFSRFGLTDFRIEYWTGTTWQTIPGATVAGNSLVWRKITFAPLSTTSIRLVVSATPDAWSRVIELEAYGN